MTLGSATAVLAKFLGSDPITRGGDSRTEEDLADLALPTRAAVCIRRH
jgi:hypothetical protein